MKMNTNLLIGLGFAGAAVYLFTRSNSNTVQDIPIKVGTTFIPGLGNVDIGVLNTVQYYRIQNVWVPAASLNSAFQAAQNSGSGQNFGQWILENADDIINLGIDLFGDLFGNGNN